MTRRRSRWPVGCPRTPGSDGVDAVEFGFAAHRGTELLPLAKSASGGELSRVMLALEVVLVGLGGGHHDGVRRGRRRSRWARRGADRSAGWRGWRAPTRSSSSPTCRRWPPTPTPIWWSRAALKSSRVVRLQDEDRVAELARMLAGLGDTDSGRAHARELWEVRPARPRGVVRPGWRGDSSAVLQRNGLTSVSSTTCSMVNSTAALRARPALPDDLGRAGQLQGGPGSPVRDQPDRPAGWR